MAQRSNLPFLWDRAKAAGISTDSLYDLNSIDGWGRIASVYDAPAEAAHSDRLFLYALVFGKRPARALEIGFRFGGTALLMLCAMEDAGLGRLVSIDPYPDPVVDLSRFAHRFTLLRGRSPADVPRAIELLGGALDFCFVDGNHDYEAVRDDLAAVAPHMAPDSYLVLHDAAYPDVWRATNELIQSSAGRVIDCGVIVPSPSPEGWGGLRLLRFSGPR